MLEQQIDHSVYIDTDEALRQCCQQWARAEVLALDTEFIRTDTFYPIAALVQVSDGNGCFLIDPLTINDFTPFAALLSDTSIVKVLHSCSEDLEVFDRLFAVLPTPLIDTQIAAALDGWGFSLSYQRMTEALLQVHVAKGETRSNWLRRPLTDSQIHYAALDVAYLPEMYQMLKDSLTEKGRFSWLQEECDLQLQRFGQGDVVESYYKKIKSVWKLAPRQLALLQHLTRWREIEAREKDVPRGRVIKDRSCFEIARQQPKALPALSRIDDLGPKSIRNYGDKIVELVEKVRAIDDAELPLSLPKPLPPEAGGLMKMLKAHISNRAEELQLAPELLAKKRDYEQLLRSGYKTGAYQLPESLSGWRRLIVGDELLALLQRDA